MGDNKQKAQGNVKTYILLAAIYLSFVALGLPDGAFGLAWPIIREEMAMPLEAISILSIVSSMFYVVVSSQNGLISKYIGADKLNLLGIFFFTVSYMVFSIAPNFVVLIVMTVFIGTGAGLIDTSLNDYMSRHFSARHMNWMHCFWGMGAAISPIIMAQMILLDSWRVGYVSIAAIQGIIAILVAASILKGFWRRETGEEKENNENKKEEVECRRYLSAGRHGLLQMLAFFVLVGIEGSVALWISSVLIESRGLPVEVAGIFPATYFACIMAGRFLFGFAAAKLGNMAIMRIGIVLTVAGIIILAFTNSVFGIALTGLGVAPMFPCLIHESSNRFAPGVLSKLVGYQMAAAGAGGATFALLMGQILSRVSLESLFPIMLILAVIVMAINEVLAWSLRRTCQEYKKYS